MMKNPVDYILPRCLATGKVCFRKREALTVKNQRTRGKRAGKNKSRVEYLRAYQCPVCDFWHLTHHRGHWRL